MYGKPFHVKKHRAGKKKKLAETRHSKSESGPQRTPKLPPNTFLNPYSTNKKHDSLNRYPQTVNSETKISSGKYYEHKVCFCGNTLHPYWTE